MILAQVLDEPVLILFSTGKDSIAMADMMMKHYKGRMEFVFLYFVPGLEYKEKLLRYYEKRWDIKIHRRESYNCMNLKCNGERKYKVADVHSLLRKEFDISWIAEGIRRDESLARRGMLAHLRYGIDERNRRLYPIADWSAKEVLSYCKINKLPLPIEYSYGLKHDISTPDVNLLLFIKNNFREDYDRIIQYFPQLEGAVWALTR